MTTVLFEDLPQVFFKSLNAVYVGDTQTWWTSVSTFTSLFSALLNMTKFTRYVVERKGRWPPLILWVINNILLIAIAIYLARQANLNPLYSEYVMPDWASKYFGHIRHNEVGYI
jgi:hypothetical protein